MMLRSMDSRANYNIQTRSYTHAYHMHVDAEPCILLLRNGMLGHTGTGVCCKKILNHPKDIREPFEIDSIAAELGKHR